MAPKDKKVTKKTVTHKTRLAHKLAKYVRANAVHHKTGDNLPSITHLAFGGSGRARVSNRACTWYPADDVKTHFKRKRLAPKAAKLSSKFVPGRVLILLSGKYRGKRVVFLKQLPSGFLLVTGPHKLNGVPLRRVNAAYVLTTSTVVPVDGVDASKVGDAFFTKVVPKGKRTEGAFKTGKRELTEEQKKAQTERSASNKETQKSIDRALLLNIKKTDLLGKYLSSRFTLYNNSRPHELVF